MDKLSEQYGFVDKLEGTFLKSNKGKFYLVSPGISLIPFEEFKIEAIGMYLASEDSGGNLRLSIEGSQLIGPNAKKGVYELNDGLFKLWFAGHDIPLKEKNSNFLIMKNGNNFFGCGKIINNKLRNYVSKSRRVTNVISV